MAEEFEGKESGFVGTCDERKWWEFWKWNLGPGCTGVVVDKPGEFLDVQDLIRQARTLPPEGVQAMVRTMDEALAGANAKEALGAVAALFPGFGGVLDIAAVGDFISRARAANAVVLEADHESTEAEQTEAVSLSATALNALGARSKAMTFAWERLRSQVSLPELIPQLDWLKWLGFLALAGVAVYGIRRVWK